MSPKQVFMLLCFAIAVALGVVAVVLPPARGPLTAAAVALIALGLAIGVTP